MPEPLTAAQQQAVAAVGLDWSKIRNLPWTQIIALLQVIIDALAGSKPMPVMLGAPSDDKHCALKEHLNHLKEIAVLQGQLAECAQCCLANCVLACDEA